MQALFYFIDDLLAGYGTDPWKTYLLDHRRIEICPVVNPDGYQRNVDTYVSSGGTTFGFWRKNASIGGCAVHAKSMRGSLPAT